MNVENKCQISQKFNIKLSDKCFMSLVTTNEKCSS